MIKANTSLTIDTNEAVTFNRDIYENLTSTQWAVAFDVTAYMVAMFIVVFGNVLVIVAVWRFQSLQVGAAVSSSSSSSLHSLRYVV